jgi:hypothetical protein
MALERRHREPAPVRLETVFAFASEIGRATDIVTFLTIGDRGRRRRT